MPNPEFIEYSTSQLRSVEQLSRQTVERRSSPTSEEGLVYPSTEWAWMMGVLSGGGHNNITRGKISLYDKDENFLEAFRSVGERLIGKNISRFNRIYLKDPESRQEYKHYYFSDINAARQLGDLRREKWPDTIVEKHSWILKNKMYVASFLAGISDTRGLINEQTGIILSTSYKNVAVLLSELLTRIDIKNPKIKYKDRTQEKIVGVGIYNLQDIKTFAANIHSKKTKKEEKLELFRHRPLVRTFAERQERNKVNTKDEAVEEWLRVKRILEQTPTKYSISQLKKLGLTKYSPNVYVRLFGTYNGKRSFGTAKEVLEKIIAEKEASVNLNEDDLKGARALFEANKKLIPKLFTDEEIIQEWIKIKELLGYTPKTTDIDKLREEGETRFSKHLYAKRFGNGSFRNARENLERLAKERGRDGTEIELKSTEEVQIFPPNV